MNASGMIPEIKVIRCDADGEFKGHIMATNQSFETPEGWTDVTDEWLGDNNKSVDKQVYAKQENQQ